MNRKPTPEEIEHPWAQPLPAGHADTKRVLDEVFAERLRAEGSLPWALSDPAPLNSEKLAVLSDQFSEVGREVVEATVAPRLPMTAAQHAEAKAKAVHHLRVELIRLAALAVAWAESIQP